MAYASDGRITEDEILAAALDAREEPGGSEGGPGGGGSGDAPDAGEDGGPDDFGPDYDDGSPSDGP